MKTEAQRIAIAEACGFTGIRRLDTVGGYRLVGYLSGTWEGKPVWNERDVPDYCGSLDAMHEAENGMQFKGTYMHWLCVVCEQQSGYAGNSAFATAAQRAEAFLRTIGKWTDT